MEDRYLSIRDLAAAAAAAIHIDRDLFNSFIRDGA